MATNVARGLIIVPIDFKNNNDDDLNKRSLSTEKMIDRVLQIVPEYRLMYKISFCSLKKQLRVSWLAIVTRKQV